MRRLAYGDPDALAVQLSDSSGLGQKTVYGPVPIDTPQVLTVGVLLADKKSSSCSHRPLQAV